MLFVAGCQPEISLTPDSDQFVAVNSDRNISITCDVTMAMATALLVINDGQISMEQVLIFESFGVFIVFESSTTISITFTRQGREAFRGSLSVQCAAFLSGPPPQIIFGPQLSVSIYGK